MRFQDRSRVGHQRPDTVRRWWQNRIAAAGVAAAVGLISGSPISAAPSAPIPKGFRLMCEDHPSECRGGGASKVAYTPKLAKLIRYVNLEVNSAITPEPDQLMDVWTINAKKGDCEEYVLAKRRALVSSGVPASSLRIVYALRHGGGHAILAVHTNKGDFVLDNKTSAITTLDRTGYKIVSMSGPNPLIWHRA